MPETAKTADQALRVLEHVADHGPLGISEIARALGLHRTVVHRLLATLLQRGYVRRTLDGYLPGGAVLRIARRVEPALLSAARPVLDQLARTHGETFILTIPADDEAIQIEQAVGGDHFVRVELSLGFRHPLARGASGRALLAFMPPERIERAIARSSAPEELARSLEQVRREGWAESHDELSPGVQGVSVPIRIDGEAIASLGAVFPVARPATPASVARILVRGATQIARSMRRSAG